MKCVKYMKWNESEMKEILDFNVPYDFQSTWTCFGNIRKEAISLACIHELESAAITESWKITIFCRVAEAFCEFPWNFLDMDFSGIFLKEDASTTFH